MHEFPVTGGISSVESETPSLRVWDYVQILLLTVLVALFLKTCVVDAYRIPSGSMENTLLAGDYLLANKFIYGVRVPRAIFSEGQPVRWFHLFGIAKPQHGDVVVFDLPEYARTHGIAAHTTYVKRCIGLPGDTIRIVNGRVRINGASVSLPEFGKQNERRIFPDGYGDSRIFPRGSAFNEDNYGPLRIPRRGDVMPVSARNFMLVKDIIEHEGHSIGLDENNNVVIDGVLRDTYEIENDYYFMIGDNRENSLDSRFWGFVPEDLIIGKVMLIYFSAEESLADAGFLGRLENIRWERIGTIIR